MNVYSAELRMRLSFVKTPEFGTPLYAIETWIDFKCYVYR
jgi:hypothetical protein